MGGWVALAAVLLLGARYGRYSKDGRLHAYPPSNIPFLALGAWVLTVGWFGFNVMSAQTANGISGLVAMNTPTVHNQYLQALYPLNPQDNVAIRQ